MDSNTTDDSSMSPLERQIKFYTLLILQTPTACCTIFIFYHFNWSRLQSQIYGILLIFNGLLLVSELSITLYFLHQGTVYRETICTPWIILNYSLFVLSIILMVWTSIERYLFIYYERLITRHYILLHYLPVVCIILYCPSFYIGVVVIYTCQSAYDVHQYVCGGACYQYERTLGLIDWIGNVLSMVLMTFLVNVVLVIRHIIQRHRMKNVVITADGRSQWRRSIRLSVQLLSITLPYFIAWFPYATIGLIQIFANTNELAYLLSVFFIYAPYIQALLLPYLCILFIPEIKQKIPLLFRAVVRWNNRVDILQLHHRTTVALQ